jgi:ATP phosphoribosyltransferase
VTDGDVAACAAQVAHAHTAASPRRAPLTLALPKGRTLGPVGLLLAKAGVTGNGDRGTSVPLAEVLEEDSRALVRRASFLGRRVDMLLLKPDDVPTYVEYGTADLGVCGRDVLVERDVDAYHPVDLGIGRCRLVVAGRKGEAMLLAARRGMPRVATKYPRTAARYFAARGVEVEIVNVQSSVELAPLTGLADLIVDLVETGATLVQNGLEVESEIFGVSTLLVANRASYKLGTDLVGPLVRALRAAVATDSATRLR